MYEIAEFLDLMNVKLKPMAYRRAARNIEALSEDIEDIYKREELEGIPGVGKGIASRIKEYLKTGQLKYLEELKSEFPKGMEEFIKIEGIGPKTALKIIKELKVNTIEELELALKQRKLSELYGFGVKKEESILRGIEFYRASKGKFLLGDILPIGKSLEEKLVELDIIQKVKIAGSIRRRNETVWDVDILIASKEPQKVINFFADLKSIKNVPVEGDLRCTVILNNNLQGDLRVIDESSYGFALQYFTGSKDHNLNYHALKGNGFVIPQGLLLNRLIQ